MRDKEQRRLPSRDAAPDARAVSATSSDLSPEGPHAAPSHAPAAFPSLLLGAIGIVFGDIGTSPLYAFKECIHGEHAMEPTRANVLGILSLIVWALWLIVTIKYLAFVMRADNEGEGGVLALLALIPERMRGRGNKIGVVAILVIAGASLLYGDGMITPAISVLSAIEGIRSEAPSLGPWVAPITCVALFVLFAIQRGGTDTIGRFFGPIMVLWFLTIGGVGAYHVSQHPSVLGAVDPRHAIRFFADHGFAGITVLGGVVLTVTGGEALYADMGHFGTKPIRIGWLVLVFPSLLLAYFGMGAVVLDDPSASSNPFYAMVPRGAPTYALVALSTAATIIASQALISGAFSLTNQAVQLGFFPRITIKHTSGASEGQIYVPEINWTLAFGCIALVLWAKESSQLAAAYGIAVTGTMTITSIVFFVVSRAAWKWPLAASLPLLIFFLSFDIPLFAANFTKLFHGGYIPLFIGSIFFLVMVVWRRGRRMLRAALSKRMKPVDEFVAEYCGGGELDGERRAPSTSRRGRLEHRISGTAVVMASLAEGIPPIVTHNAERLKVLHETMILLTIVTAHVPYVARGKRARVELIGGGFHRIIGTYGFMETPDVPALLQEAREAGLEADIDDVTYLLARETILGLPGGAMGALEESLFAILSRNSRPATHHFKLPFDKVIEIGTQLDL